MKEELELWGEGDRGQETTILLGTWPLVLCAGVYSLSAPPHPLPFHRGRGQMNATETLVVALEIIYGRLAYKGLLFRIPCFCFFLHFLFYIGV